MVCGGGGGVNGRAVGVDVVLYGDISLVVFIIISCFVVLVVVMFIDVIGVVLYSIFVDIRY